MTEKVQSLFNSFINDVKAKINETFNISSLNKENQSKYILEIFNSNFLNITINYLSFEIYF